MRFKSKKVDGFQVFAVSGTNTISFAIQVDDNKRKGLLGFAVERLDVSTKQRYYMYGFKVFESIQPKPSTKDPVSTYTHPVQSLVWDDFTATDDHEYEYFFHPLHGTADNLDRSAKPIPIPVKTERLYGDKEHDIFFNRGVASSQAYVRKFGNQKPDNLPPAERTEALQWLSRELDEALLKFIGNAKKGDGLLCCFYEFRYEPVALALKDAITRGVDVKIILDAKVNESQKKNKKTGKMETVESFPREDNLRMVKTAKLPTSSIVLREARSGDIQHNKFMVLLKGKTRKATEVWTGSTNISMGGIHGQTNVGHWVKDPTVAAHFVKYWEFLKTDPGAVDGDDRSTALKKNTAQRSAVAKLGKVPTRVADIDPGITSIFSPRPGTSVLELYVDLVDTPISDGCITLAFGVNKLFKDAFIDNVAHSPLLLLLLEKQDEPSKAQNEGTAKEPFVAINSKQNVYKAWGSYIEDPAYQWARETNAKILQLNQHVAYIHSKFLLRDPLGADPIVVTGSANFSAASTNANDENMLIVRGNRRVADIYFTEFNRIFNHYYFRSVQEQTRRLASSATKKKAQKKPMGGSPFLGEDDHWLDNYKPGSLKQKRADIVLNMVI